MANGEPDVDFGAAGSIVLGRDELGRNIGNPYAAAAQPNGKILVAKVHGGDVIVSRYNEDGTLDAAFGEAGDSIIDGLGFTPSVVPRALLLQPDGKILVFGSLASREMWVARLHGDPPPPPVCGNRTVEAGEACDDGNTTDGDGCSSACVVESPPPPPPSSADLFINMRSRPTARVKGMIRYAIDLRNNGPDRAVNVVVEDTLPAGVDFVSATIATPYSCTYTESSRLVRCTLPGFVSGYTYSISLTVTARSVGTRTNTVTVRSDTVDPTPGNNASSSVVTVGG